MIQALSKKILLFLSLNVFCFVPLLFFQSLHFALFLSYEFAYFSSCLIIIFSYLTYKKNILKKVKSYKSVKIPAFISLKKINKNTKIFNFKALDEDFKISLKLALKNFTVFFSIIKLFSYILLILGFLFLQKQNLLEIFAYLWGIFALLISFFVLVFKDRQ